MVLNRYPDRGSMSLNAISNRAMHAVQRNDDSELELMSASLQDLKDQFDEEIINSVTETGLDNASKALVDRCLHLMGYDFNAGKWNVENQAVEQSALENFPDLFIQYAVYSKSVSKINKFFESHPRFIENKFIETPMQRSLMHIAVSLGSLQVVQALHENNLPIYMESDRWSNPLQEALIFIFSRPAHVKNLTSQRYRLVEFLIKKYGELDKRDGQDRINQYSLMTKEIVINGVSNEFNMNLLDMIDFFKAEQAVTEGHEMYDNLLRLENLLVENGAKTTAQILGESEGNFANPIFITA